MTERQAQDQCELSCNKQNRNKPQEYLWSHATPTQPISGDPEQNGAQTKRDRHGKQMKYHACAIEALHVLEPLRRPEPLQSPSRSNAGCREWRNTPEARIGIDLSQAGRDRAAWDQCRLGHDEIDHYRASGSQHSEQTKQFTPANPVEQEVGR